MAARNTKYLGNLLYFADEANHRNRSVVQASWITEFSSASDGNASPNKFFRTHQRRSHSMTIDARQLDPINGHRPGTVNLARRGRHLERRRHRSDAHIEIITMERFQRRIDLG